VVEPLFGLDKRTERGISLLLIALCSWWFFWPIYQLTIGEITLEILFQSSRKLLFFIIGGAITIPSMFLWRKTIVFM